MPMIVEMPKRRPPKSRDPLDRDKIKELRVSAGLTQEQAAERAGMRGGKSQWSDIETGRSGGITLLTLAAIADALGVDPGELLRK